MSAVLGCSGHTAAAARLGNLQNVSRVQEASFTSIYLYLPVSTNQFGNEEKPGYIYCTQLRKIHRTAGMLRWRVPIIHIFTIHPHLVIVMINVCAKTEKEREERNIILYGAEVSCRNYGHFYELQ